MRHVPIGRLGVSRRRFLAGLGAGSVWALPGRASPVQAGETGLSALIPSTPWAQGLVEDFNRRFAGRIRLTLEEVPYNQLNEKMAAYVAAGQAPDVSRAFTGYTRDWQTQGLLDPVDDVLGKGWMEALVPSLTRPPHGDMIDGRLYMAYYSLSVLGIMARRDLLRQVRLDPLGMKTFDDLIAGAERIARETGVRRPISMVLGNALAAAETSRWIFTSHGLDSIADFRPERRPAYLAALQVMLRMAPLVPESAFAWDYGQAGQAFAEGVTALYPIGSWFFATIYAQAPHAVAEPRAVPIPYPGGAGFPFQSVKFNANGWYLMRASQHRAEAGEFLRFATAKDTLLRHVNDGGGLLPFKGVTADDQVRASRFGEAQRWYFRDWLQLMETVRLTVDVPYVAAAETQQVWHDAVVNVMRGRLTPEQGYGQMAQRIVPLQQRLRRG